MSGRMLNYAFYRHHDEQRWRTVRNVRAPLDFGGGGGDLIARKKLHNAQKHVLYKRTQIAVKTKTVPILTSNERIIIPELQLYPNFSNLRGKRKLVRKIGYFEKSGVTKIRVFD